MQDLKKSTLKLSYAFLFQIFLYPEVLENFSLSEIMKLSTQLVNKQFAYTGKLY